MKNKLFCAKKSTQADQFREVFYIEIDECDYIIGQHYFFFFELDEEDEIQKQLGNKK
ncbi:hypothetical protein PSI23_10210 [Xenorhabdus sp. XENO-10]|uniref:Uncharacterized protein n=1 Tax=Xenorhabdus yunnanensis TaxID=3025878 RepID=A0ABT5LFB6_9GAMM|nr:hypothetical protein [Xenorhabdus yunnanensis]MDC9589659.1 hypothetical protein [Xenorhabdus yunnanensis]